MRSRAKRGGRRPGRPTTPPSGTRSAQRARIRRETLSRQIAEREIISGGPYQRERMEEGTALRLFKELPEVRVSA